MIYDFAVGRTNPATFPLEAFQHAAARAIARDYPHYTNYPGELGHEGSAQPDGEARIGARGRAGGGGADFVDERLDAGGHARGRSADRTPRRHRHHRGVHVSRHDFDVSRSRHPDGRIAGRRGRHAARRAASARSKISPAKARRRASSIPKRRIRTRPARRFRARDASRFSRSRNGSA